MAEGFKDTFKLWQVIRNLNDWFRDGAGLRVSDTDGNDYADFDHDGTDFNTTFVNTTDWNIVDANLRIGDSTGSEYLHVDRSDGECEYHGYGVQFNRNASYLRNIQGATSVLYIEADGSIQLRDYSAGLTKFQVDFANSRAEVRDGYALRIHDSGDTDYAQFSHDGTNFVINCTNTNSIAFRWAGDEKFAFNNAAGFLSIQDGHALRVHDSTNTDYANFSHDGANFITTYANTGYANYTGLTSGYSWTVNGTEKMVLGQNYLNIKGDADLRIYDATDTDTAIFNHDGTNFNTTFTTTTDWNITGLAGNVKIGANDVVVSSGTTGGTGSAGAGNKYVEIDIGGTTYKVLHDGTV